MKRTFAIFMLLALTACNVDGTVNLDTRWVVTNSSASRYAVSIQGKERTVTYPHSSQEVVDVGIAFKKPGGSVTGLNYVQGSVSVYLKNLSGGRDVTLNCNTGRGIVATIVVDAEGRGYCQASY